MDKSTNVSGFSSAERWLIRRIARILASFHSHSSSHGGRMGGIILLTFAADECLCHFMGDFILKLLGRHFHKARTFFLSIIKISAIHASSQPLEWGTAKG
jgi:hypothetical protein